jgi:intracellular septation protein
MPAMKLLFDLFPVILFFVSLQVFGKNPELAASWVGSCSARLRSTPKAPILLATVVVIVPPLPRSPGSAFRHGKVDKMLWVSLVLVVVFGGMTLAFQNESFIKWKPTILYWVFAGSMAFSCAGHEEEPDQGHARRATDLPESVWGKVNLSWIAFFS